MSLANHDANVMVESGEKTNLRADLLDRLDGSSFRVPNTLGGVARDAMHSVELAGRFLPVGFYYKAFYKPLALFPFWERMIRRLAGIGKLDLAAKPERLPKRYAFCDVLVVGAGPSGMSAALSAADAGARVILVDENRLPGGSLDYQHANDPAAASERERLGAGVTSHSRIETMLGAEACGWYEDHWVPVVRPGGIVNVRARAIVVATGVIEQPAVFRNNDLPGVMLASGAQRAMARFAVKPCESAVLLVSNEDGYRAALDCVAAGIRIAAIADLEDSAKRGHLAAEVAAHGVPIMDRSAIQELRASRGRVESAVISRIDESGRFRTGTRQRVTCDGVLVSVGWTPADALLQQSGCDLIHDEGVGQFVVSKSADGIFPAGRVDGVYELSDRIADGASSGRAAAAHAAGEAVPRAAPSRSTSSRSHPYPIFDHPKGKNFVDFDEDLQLEDLLSTANQGFDSIELMKRFSAIGMGPSQGKLSNRNGIRILARHRGQSIDSTGSTTSRPFFHPVPIRSLAGRGYRPRRHTPIHDDHIERRAIFTEAGAWLRPEYYAKSGDRQADIRAEARAVRERAGLIDVSTLGKLEAIGPDASRLMDELFTLRMSRQPVGTTRYGLMVDDSGVIVDDGVVVRCAEDHFYFTTTTTGADAVFRDVRKMVVEYGYDVDVVNRTGHLAAISLAGPLAREVLSPLTDVSLDPTAFPERAARDCVVAGCAAKLLRVGFVSDLGFEVHVRAREGANVWTALLEAGEPRGLATVGIEAQRLLRLEMGHPIVGQDTDGLTNPWEANLGWAVQMKKERFRGRRSLEILRPRREKQLYGFQLPAGGLSPVLRESNLVVDGDAIVGRITSVSWSPGLQRVIGLAYVNNPDLRPGAIVEMRTDDGSRVRGEICALPFYDPQIKPSAPATDEGATTGP